MKTYDLDQFIENILAEDLGDGDHSTLAVIPDDARGKAKLLVKEAGILAGVELAERVFGQRGLAVRRLLDDGASVKPGDIAFFVEGRVHDLLQLERPVLNLMQHMSGIATKVRRYLDRAGQVPQPAPQLVDTRKTTPGMRLIDKRAVLIGGGHNHRMGLYAMIMLKDNHIDFAGGIDKAIAQAVDYLRRTGRVLPIAVEARDLDEVEQILAHAQHVERIMLDNFSPERAREAVRFIGGRCKTEATGGINIDNIDQFFATGVNYISVGDLTHHVDALDLSLKAV